MGGTSGAIDKRFEAGERESEGRLILWVGVKRNCCMCLRNVIAVCSEWACCSLSFKEQLKWVSGLKNGNK